MSKGKDTMIGTWTLRRGRMANAAAPKSHRKDKGRREASRPPQRATTLLVVAALVVTSTVLVWPAARVGAATFKVNSTADGVDTSPGDGSCLTIAAVCTLRAAVQEVNGLTTNGVGGPHTIRLPAGVYQLTGSISDRCEDDGAKGDLDIKANISILGDGAVSTTIDGAGVDRVFDILDGFSVTIRDVTIQNGKVSVNDPCPLRRSGGGLSNRGILTVEDSVIRKNGAVGSTSGGGLHNDGTQAVLTINRSTISDNSSDSHGGGINNEHGKLSLSNTTVSRNYATVEGAGIHSAAGTITLAASTISLNGLPPGANIKGTRRGGGISNSGAAQATITNCTISGNVADFGDGGAILQFSGALLVSSSTVTKNTDGVTSSGAIPTAIHGQWALQHVTLVNTIIDERGVSSSGIAGKGCSHVVTSRGYNIDAGSSCLQAPATGDKSNTDPRLGPLTRNGGVTETHALLAGSPAIDTTPPQSTPGTDQRGTRRPQSSLRALIFGPRLSDTGAYELFQIVVLRHIRELWLR